MIGTGSGRGMRFSAGRRAGVPGFPHIESQLIGDPLAEPGAAIRQVGESPSHEGVED
jgi:hypothetical protein